MIGYFTLILSCQLAGELIAGTFALPVPGPVLGMVILFFILVMIGQVPEDLDRTASGLLRYMSLLFVPAGTGVILHFQLLSQAMLPIGIALLVSTTATILITAWIMQWLAKEPSGG